MSTEERERPESMTPAEDTPRELPLTPPPEEGTADETAAAEPPFEDAPLSEDTSLEEDAPLEEGGLVVRFNRRRRVLSPEETAGYAQQGLKWEQFAPAYRQLQYISDQLGSPVGTVVEELLRCCEQQEWEALLAAHPEDTAQAARLFAAAREERSRRFAPAPEVSDAQRLAADYRELKQEVPDAPTLRELPPQVPELSAREGIPLLDAYLRYRHREQRRCLAADTTAAAAATHTTGSLHSETDTPDTAGDAFRRALYRML